MRIRGACFLVLSVVPLLVARPASAEPAGDVNTARRLFQEATELEQASEWKKAGEKLDAALAIKETPGLHFHRAHCAEQSGELVLAARHYERSDEMIRAGATAPDVEELLVPARARVLARVPRLKLVLPRDVAAATFEIDGTRVSEVPGTPILLDPGSHRVVARASGRADFETETTLVEGQTRTLEVVFAATAPQQAPRAPVETKPSEHDSSGWGVREIVLVGEVTVTVAGLAAGVGFSFAKASATDRATEAQKAVDAASGGDERACKRESPPLECADLEDAIDDHDRSARFATIGFVAAGAGAAATLATWLLWPAERTRVTASVAPNRGGATLSLRGSF
jgi:hypothetical protein